MLRLFTGLLAVALLAVALVGCGGDDDDDDDTPAAPTATAGTSATSATGSTGNDGTFTEEELQTFGVDLMEALASGDTEELTAVLGGIASPERIEELAACKTDDMEFSNINVAVAVDPPAMQVNGTVDRTQDGDTETLVVLWDSELSEVAPGEYTISSGLPSGCPFIFQ